MEDTMAAFFTYEERLTLQKLLKEGLSFKKIAAQLHKDPSTISREVRKYSVEVATGKPGFSFNACKNRFSCKVKPPALCGKDCTRRAVPILIAVSAVVMNTARTLSKKSVPSGRMFLMSAMPVPRLINALCSRLFMMRKKPI